ncbi:MAG: GNAT family N-acetyltransferase [Dokdonella sp.]
MIGIPLRLQIHQRISEIAAAQWDALVPDANPFLSHAFLDALEAEHCLRSDYGWTPHHFSLHTGDELIGAVPLYLKRNSHGEFVFDWAWANAWEQAGHSYYPKLLVAVPYSPVTGPRLLVGTAANASSRRLALAQALHEHVNHLGLSSVHANFTNADDAAALARDGWLRREDTQFHWRNRGWPDFEAFLAALTAKKRKNIRQERAHVASAGIRCTMKHGHEIDDQDWSAIHDLYVSTFEDHGNLPVLTEGFFRRLAITMPARIIVCECRHGDQLVAMAFFLRSEETLYGRYWGAHVDAPDLHFEACYYQGIDYCLRHGLKTFEPGAQGEHKIARGFLPTATQSFHYLRDEGFRHAVADYLRRETVSRRAYRADLMLRSPYRDGVDE